VKKLYQSNLAAVGKLSVMSVEAGSMNYNNHPDTRPKAADPYISFVVSKRKKNRTFPYVEQLPRFFYTYIPDLFTRHVCVCL
jgi:hypothetical protein